jgi:hypothetical protein
MANNFPPVSKIFEDLEDFRNFCVYGWCQGHYPQVFNEADLYNERSRAWQAYINRHKPRAKRNNNNFKKKRSFN